MNNNGFRPERGRLQNSALFLFNRTKNMPEPWYEAGIECHLVDNGFTDKELARDDGYIRHRVDLLGEWLPPIRNYVFACAFVPCTNTAVSGARWFRGKGIDGLLWSLKLFKKARDIIKWTGAPGFIENPVSTFSTYCGKPDYTFHPHQYTGLCADDNYTKKTCLWAFGGFQMPQPVIDPALGVPDNRIHTASPSENRADLRSVTPRGFSRAVYTANAP